MKEAAQRAAREPERLAAVTPSKLHRWFWKVACSEL